MRNIRSANLSGKRLLAKNLFDDHTVQTWKLECRPRKMEDCVAPVPNPRVAVVLEGA